MPTDIPPGDRPGRGRSWFVTTDPGQAHEFIDRTCGAPPGRDTMHQDWLLALSQVSAGGLSYVELTLSPDLTIHLQSTDELSVLTLHAGTTRARLDHHTERYRAGDVCLGAFPHADYEVACHDLRVGVITLPAAALAQVTATAPDHHPDRPPRPLRFTTLRPRSPAGSAQWKRVAGFLRGVLDDEQTATNPLITGAAARLLAATALTVFPNTALTDPGEPGTASPAAVRRAEEFIHAHARTDIALADLAAVARVTPRALQHAFARHHQMSPLAYLRQVRLAGAHTDLAAADPTTGATVTGIATTWGFARPSRFAAAYRAAYGQPPSHTLRDEPGGREVPHRRP